jgi:hypothetical protein
MPDLKISQLPVATTPLAGTELVPIVQGGVTDQTTVQAILTGTVPSGTANGVMFLNGSKVATTGSALTFDGTNLGVGGAVNAIAGYTSINISGGASGAFTDYKVNGTLEARILALPTDFRIQNITNGSVSFYTNSTEQMRLTSTGLGIGTSSVTSKLVIQQANNTGDGIRQFANGNDSQLITRYLSSIDAWQVTASYASTGAYKPITWFTSDLERMRLDSPGNLGLGVTPSAWGSIFRVQQFGNYGAFIAGRSDAQNQIQMGVNAFFDGTNFVYSNTDVASRYYQISGQHRWDVAPSGTAGNAISFTQAMTLVGTSTPALLVGTTSDFGGFNFQAKNQVGFSVHNSADNSTAAYFSAAGNVTLTSAGSSAVVNGVDGILLGVNGTERARITSAGDFITNVNAAAPTLGTNSTMSFELTSNTSLKIVVRGTDGVTRSVSLTLA